METSKPLSPQERAANERVAHHWVVENVARANNEAKKRQEAKERTGKQELAQEQGEA